MLTFNGCKKNNNNHEVSEQLKLNSAYNKWKTSGISTYTFKIAQRDCECDGRTYEISIKNNTKLFVKDAQGQQVNPINHFKTIDEMFTLITSSLNKDPYYANIDYDPTYGYPVDIYIDLIKQMIDEEVSYTITDFKN
ncbi:MAG: DUF6174 domain-containing protein [Sphingobacteriaceae bacterium]